MDKAIVSACLLGEYCRYDGKTKKDSAVVQALQGYEIIPFCPEAPLFGTPRERISVVKIDGENRIITDESNKDVTQKLQEEIASFIQKNPHAKRIVLKSKSPSCGLGTTPILDEHKNILAPQGHLSLRSGTYGNGIAAEMIVKQFPHAKISDEINL